LATFGEAIQRARQLLGGGDLDQAEQIYRRLIEAVPQAADPWHELGIAQLQANRPGAAVEYLRQAVTLEPATAAYHVNLAAAYRMLKRPGDAIASFQRALKLAPPTAELLNNFALTLKDTGQADAALGAFDDALRIRPQYANGHFNRGNLLAEMGRLEEASASYARAVELEPDDAAAHCKLGLVYLELGQLAEVPPSVPARERTMIAAAADSFRQAMLLDPHYAGAHADFVALLEQQGWIDEAVDCWRNLLQHRPGDVAAYNNLGALLATHGQCDEAAQCWRRALELKPDFAEAHNNLAALLESQDQLIEAEQCCRRAIAIRPDFAEAHGNLAGVLTRQNKLVEAVAAYHRALELRPEFAEMYNNLGAVLEKVGRFDEAADCSRRALAIKPHLAEATTNLGMLLAEQGKVAEARECYRQALEVQPENPIWKLSLLSLCPNVFHSNEEIDDYRQRLLAELEAFDTGTIGHDFPNQATSGCMPSFNLQYQGRDDRQIRAAYARLFQDCFAREAPQASTGPAKIGFVVTNRHERAFVKSMGAVLERMNPKRFELVVFCVDRGVNALRAAIRGEHIRFVSLPGPLDRCAATIREERLDVLYYWEIGTDFTNYFLPYYRLAPVQCTSWGIQVTSGVPQVDYYLSSALLEPANTAQQYSEQLVLANTLLTFQHRVAVSSSPKSRKDFGLPGDRHVYLCVQQLRKFHPDFDALLAAILRREPQGIVVTAEDRHGDFLGAQLRQRFAATMPDVAGRVVFLPSQHPDDYLSLVATADVLLDPLHYGGVNSSYDGFSLGQPIVTLPAGCQRGRYTLACYEKMGIADCIAADAEHYVDIAVRLGTDPTFRATVVEKIQRASPLLFDDLAAVREHERIFAELAKRARSRSHGS
jgi:predicted O-linked N-acetylglucosamine transferase (SPINDLY family)